MGGVPRRRRWLRPCTAGRASSQGPKAAASPVGGSPVSRSGSGRASTPSRPAAMTHRDWPASSLQPESWAPACGLARRHDPGWQGGPPVPEARSWRLREPSRAGEAAAQIPGGLARPGARFRAAKIAAGPANRRDRRAHSSEAVEGAAQPEPVRRSGRATRCQDSFARPAATSAHSASCPAIPAHADVALARRSCCHRLASTQYQNGPRPRRRSGAIFSRVGSSTSDSRSRQPCDRGPCRAGGVALQGRVLAQASRLTCAVPQHA